MGEKAAELLINKLENENEQIEEQYKTIIIETELVERESTK
jgi:LacI family transcriptional regulator